MKKSWSKKLMGKLLASFILRCSFANPAISMTFLCIDDDPEDLEVLTEAIGKIDPGSVCITANNGQKALEMLQVLRPDFIFLDINMPVMDGRQTLRAIRLHHAFKQVPVCILSTTITDTQRELLMKTGADYCLKKASTFADLYSTIRSVLSARQSI